MNFIEAMSRNIIEMPQFSCYHDYIKYINALIPKQAIASDSKNARTHCLYMTSDQPSSNQKKVKVNSCMKMINYAHRGASAYYPENTLRSFYAGLDMGASGIETDIERSKDGVLVLHHDDTLERIPNVKGAVSDYTYAELLEMDFGKFMGKKFTGERIVRLDTFLTHFGRRGLTLALEIKQAGIEEDCLACVTELKCRDDVIFTSFMWESILQMRRLDPTIRLGYLTKEITAESLDLLEAYHIQQICPRISSVTRESMDLALKRGFSVRFWGVTNTDLMQRAIELGGDGMTVNFPDKLTLALASV